MLAIEHAGGGQHGSRDDLAAVGEREALVSRVDRHPGHFERREKLGAEPLRLRHRAACQLAAADAGRKPEIVLDPGTACPPVRPARAGRAAASAALPMRRTPPPRGRPDRRRRSRGRTHRRRPRAIGRGARPPGAAPGCAARDPSSKNSAGSSSAPTPAASSRPRASGSRVDVEPAIGDEIAREEILDRVRSRRPLVSDQPQSLRLGQILGLPGVEQIVDHREEAFLGRIPRLRQVVIEMRLVDGLDGRFDVRVGREQDAPRQRVHLARSARALRLPACPASADR